MPLTTENFTPTEIWTPENAHSELDAAVAKAIADMNGLDYGKMIKRLRHDVDKTESGVVMALMKGERPDEYSTTDALVAINPHAHGMTDNMLVRGELIRKTARFLNVRDGEGKLKPVVLLATAGINGSNVKLSKEDRKVISDGNLGPYAKELLHGVESRDIGSISLVGFSGGADLALAGSKHEYSSNLDVTSTSVGDVVGVEERSLKPLFDDFSNGGPASFQYAIEATGLDAQKAAVGSKKTSLQRNLDGLHMMASMPYPLNLDIARGMGHNNFLSNAEQLLAEGMVDRLVVGYGGNSAITKAGQIEPALAQLSENEAADKLVTIKVDGADHGWGDRLDLLTKLYLRAVV
jgi:hypothetical protein